MNAECARGYARFAGILILISLIAGGFGEAYAPSKLLVSADPAATLKNIAASPVLYRLSFATYLVEALCDVTLALVFYLLLEPVSRNVALLAAFFGLVSTATFAFAEFFYFAPSLLLSGRDFLRSWPAAQQELFTQASILLYGLGGAMSMAFYGTASLLRGVLIFQSGYLPRALGVLLVLAGAGFVVGNFVAVLVPRFNSPLYALPMFVGMVALGGWLSIRGLDSEGWVARAAKGAPGSI